MNQRLYSIDFIRGMAMIMVFLCHSVQRVGGMSDFFRYFQFGMMGCQIFFFASGYSLAQMYGGGTFNKYMFWKKRYASIAPGYYISIVLVIIMNSILYYLFDTFDYGFATNSSPLSIVCNLFFLNGILPFCNNDVAPGGWFIGTMAIFYALYPFIEKLCKPRWVVIVITLPIIIVIMMSQLCGIDFLPHDFIYFSFLVEFPCFFLGVLAQRSPLKLSNYGLMALGVIWSVIAFVLCIWGYDYSYSYSPSAMGLSIFFIYVYLRRIEESKDFNFENCKFLCYIGRYSYYIFLTHCFVCFLLPLFARFILAGHININYDVLYLILLPVMVLSTIICSLCLKRLCQPITKYIRYSIFHV